MWRRNKSNRALALLFLLTGCSAHSLFYFPNRNLYNDPAALGLPHQTVQYPSLNGKKLWALYLPTDQPPKGTVVHFHGNFGNFSNHFPLSVFLVKKGFDVLIFDYQGYGGSEGKPTPKNTVDDGIASIRYAQTTLRDPKTGVVVLGQSLGGAAGIVAVAMEPLVKAVVFESAFSSYPRMGKEVLRRSAWTWIFSFMMPLFLGRTYDPLRYVADISPRPVFFIHGDADKIVPAYMSRDLFEKAREPKRLWIIEGAGHLENRRKMGHRYDEEIATFFLDALKAPPTNKPAN